MNLKKIFKGKKVIITGHNGFKGSWLTLWLCNLGAKVVGISLDPPSTPSHYKVIKINKKVKEKKIDIRKLAPLRKAFKKYKPDFVFHLAAQSLVRKSYINPIITWDTNALGTRNILESLRVLKNKCVVIL